MNTNRIFSMNLLDKDGGLVFVGIEDKNALWHMRLGNLNFQTVKTLLSMVIGIPQVEDCKEVYVECECALIN